MPAVFPFQEVLLNLVGFIHRHRRVFLGLWIHKSWHMFLFLVACSFVRSFVCLFVWLVGWLARFFCCCSHPFLCWLLGQFSERYIFFGEYFHVGFSRPRGMWSLLRWKHWEALELTRHRPLAVLANDIVQVRDAADSLEENLKKTSNSLDSMLPKVTWKYIGTCSRVFEEYMDGAISMFYHAVSHGISKYQVPNFLLHRLRVFSSTIHYASNLDVLKDLQTTCLCVKLGYSQESLVSESNINDSDH